MVITTQNTTYTLIDQGDGGFLISGNEKYCHFPTLCTLDFQPEVGYSFIFRRRSDRKPIVTTPVVRIEA